MDHALSFVIAWSGVWGLFVELFKVFEPWELCVVEWCETQGMKVACGMFHGYFWAVGGGLRWEKNKDVVMFRGCVLGVLLEGR